MENWFSHPATVHLPLALGLILPFAFLATAIGIRRGYLSTQSWFFPVAGLWLLFGSGLLAYLTGERAKFFSAADSTALRQHEMVAQVFIAISLILVFLSIFLIAPRWKRFQARACFVITFILFVQVAITIYLGRLGGHLVFGS